MEEELWQPWAQRRRGDRRGLGEATADSLAREEPLEIQIGGEVFATVMRTPGHDRELAAGLLHGEGLIDQPGDVASLAHCRDVPAESRGNVLRVHLREGLRFDAEQHRRHLLAASACGVCGKAQIERLGDQAPALAVRWSVTPEHLLGLEAQLRALQEGFEQTGGLHAAALFHRDGRLLLCREDVGRHNAVDKVVGSALRHSLLPLESCLLLVSGRASFEIVQKARRAGIPLIAALSAPTSLAVELALQGGQTLVGLLREDSFNVYCGSERVATDPGPS